MPRFLPSLRTKPAPTGRPGHKAVLDEYYAALAQAGIGPGYRSRPWPVERAVEEGYERVIWCFKAVDAIAGNAANLPFVLKQGEELVEDHPLLRLLNHGHANPLETGHQLRKRLSAQILLSKAGAFVEVTQARSGEPKRLDLLPPGRTRIVPGTGADLIDHFEIVRVDGTRRRLDPGRVRWFRDPHPIDPYSGTTPLEAAGLSIELDYFARAYNATFMRNDGRPGGVLAVKSDMSENDMNRVEARFGRGPHETGKLSVINGEMTYADLAAKPRDMAHQETAQVSKTEILTAFGCAESVLGHAADRTFSNAEQELHNFWTVTMPPHLGMVVTGFDADSDDDLTGGFDTSEVEALQRAATARREEARAEFGAGLISPDEYRRRAGYETVDTPFTRALYIPTGKTPIPTREEDRAALGMTPPSGGEHPAVGTEREPAGSELEDGGEPPPPSDGNQPSPASDGPPGPDGQPRSPAAAVAAARTTSPDGKTTTQRRVIRIARPREHKDRSPSRSSDPDLDARDQLERAVAAALRDVSRRMVDRAVARLGSPRTRKHTRHFTPDYPVDTRVGVKALDAPRAVDGGRWQAEAERDARPLVEAAAYTAAAAVLVELGVVSAGEGLPESVAAAVAAAVAAVVALIDGSVERQARLLVTVVTDAEADGLDLDGIVARVRLHTDGLGDWADGLATQVATATAAGARDAAATAAATQPGRHVAREWRSQRDQKVRPTHVAADGQRRPLGSPYEVGGVALRFPGDPLAPWRETAGCRCFQRYFLSGTDHPTPRPAGEATTNPQGRVELLKT